MTLRYNQRLLLAASEGSSYGVAAAVTGANALIINDDMELTPLAGEVTQRTIIRPFMGGMAGLMRPGPVGISFSVDLAGSGAAGTAPGISDVLRACRLSQTVTGSALTGTATAGGAGTITLAVGASAIDGFYNGQIITNTGGTGSGDSGLITGYVGSTRVATVERISAAYTAATATVYSIAANVAFKPISVIHGVADTSATLCYNLAGVEHRLLGFRGDWSFSDFVVGSIPKLRFTGTGIYSPVTDTAQSTYTLSYLNQADPFEVSDEQTKAFTIFGNRGCMHSFEFGFQNDVQFNERINCGQQVNIQESIPTGTVVMDAQLMATFNPFLLALDDSSFGAVGWVHGQTAGRRTSFVAPRVDLGQVGYGSPVNGRAMWNLPFTATATAPGGNEAYLVFS